MKRAGKKIKRKEEREMEVIQRLKGGVIGDDDGFEEGGRV
jgi:hypothetical protein